MRKMNDERKRWLPCPVPHIDTEGSEGMAHIKNKELT
jgi:hypothetical protein